MTANAYRIPAHRRDIFDLKADSRVGDLRSRAGTEAVPGWTDTASDYVADILRPSNVITTLGGESAQHCDRCGDRLTAADAWSTCIRCRWSGAQ